MDFIPYGRQDINQEDIDSVVDVLKAPFITQGPKILEFEKVLKDYVGAKHCTVFNSATSALHTACQALQLGPGSLLWTSPVSFVASSNSALYMDAQVDFVDIDPVSFNMSVDSLKLKIEQAQKDNRLPDVVMPVHLCGQSCDMKEIYELSKEYNFKIIEDGSHAVGASYGDQKVGSCQYSDIAVFSFHPVKIITTGEGGALFTNSDELLERVQLGRSHGVTKNPSQYKNEPHGSWYYEQHALGFNYRMTDIQAALGVSQMKRLDNFIQKRNEIALRYDELLKDLDVKTPVIGKERESSFHLYVIQVDPLKKKAIFESLREASIGVNVHYMPIHMQPYYQQKGFKYGDFPKSEAYYASAISLPMYPTLKESEQNYVINTLTKFL